MKKRKRRGGGPRREPDQGTPLYTVCPTCNGKQEYELDGQWHKCICQDGYVSTGFTQERYDHLVTDHDKLLILLDDLETFGYDAVRARIAEALSGKDKDVEAARDRQ